MLPGNPAAERKKNGAAGAAFTFAAPRAQDSTLHKSMLSGCLGDTHIVGENAKHKSNLSNDLDEIPIIWSSLTHTIANIKPLPRNDKH